MATQRYISTSFWDDRWIRSINPADRYLYLYLMTNPLTNIAGIYEITVDRIAFDTGYDERTLRPMLERFAKAGKAYHHNDEWIIIPRWPRHQKITKRSNIKTGIDAILLDLPEDVYRTVIEANYDYEYLQEIKEKRPLKPLKGPSKPLNYSDLDTDTDRDTNTDSSGASLSASPSREVVPVEVSADEAELYTAVKADFLKRQPQHRFTNYGKEGKAIKQLIEKAKARSPDRPAEFLGSMIKMFRHLRQSGDKFWRGQPDLPSALNASGIWDRVLSEGYDRYQAEVDAEDIYTGVAW